MSCIKLLAFLAVAVFLVAYMPITLVLGAEDSWTSMAAMPTARMNLNLAEVGGKLYAIGGHLAPAYTINEEYNPVTNTWATKEPMPTGRVMGGSAIAVWQNQIYVIGGDVDRTRPPDGTNEAYDPTTDSWATKASLPTPRGGYSASTACDKIYVFGGGWSGLNPETMNYQFIFYNFTDVYDPINDSWSTVAPPPIPIYTCQSVAFEEKIYVLSEDLIQVYDPVANKWLPEIRAPMNFSSSAQIVATTGAYAPQRIHIVDSRQHYIYDTKEGTWNIGAPLLTPRDFFALCVFNDKLYAVGGVHNDGWWSRKNEEYTPTGYGTPDPSYSPPPSPVHTQRPSPSPSASLSPSQTIQPTVRPTLTPTPTPTLTPSPVPTVSPTSSPTEPPTQPASPTQSPTPSLNPTEQPQQTPAINQLNQQIEVLGAVVVVVVAVGVAVLVRVRSRKR
jgi:N-acetylneuraminic acid mutarotase